MILYAMEYAFEVPLLAASAGCWHICYFRWYRISFFLVLTSRKEALTGEVFCIVGKPVLLTGWLCRADPINVSKCPYPNKIHYFPYNMRTFCRMLLIYIYTYLYVYEFLVYSYYSFTHILKGCFIGTSPIVRLLLCQWYIVFNFFVDGRQLGSSILYSVEIT